MVMCQDELEEEIKTMNVIDILQLADLHGVRELKRECLEFIKSNSKAVQKMTGWEDLKGNGDSKSLYIWRSWSTYIINYYRLCVSVKHWVMNMVVISS